MSTKDIEPRRGSPDPEIDEAEFRRRFKSQFMDPAFNTLENELDRIARAAWDAYSNHRKSPNVRKAGAGFSDPEYDIAVDWLEAREKIMEAQKSHENRNNPINILVVSASSRSEHTCPGEMSKSYRLAKIAAEAITAEQPRAKIEILELHRLASEYGRRIHPCKACFSTSPALCHWPCSCYPNYSLGQTQDWMNEIYPMWVAAHGIMVVTPVNWYQVSSPLKLMMDRLVCADGGNPDPTSTHGKSARQAKEIELAGWSYPRHLAGRRYSVIAYGDAEGAENVRRSVSDWLRYMSLIPAGRLAEFDRYIGYWKPYATSHSDLDADNAMQEEVRNAARTLVQSAVSQRSGQLAEGGGNLTEPRQK